MTDANPHTQLEPKPEPAGSSEDAESPVTIVGIGASAGGLAALRQFFSYLPEDCGLTFVIVVHLDPSQKSHLAELLQPHVKMPVQQVTETVPLEKNRVYIIPPNANLNTIDTHLRLSELEERRRERAPIDHFFRTLAKTHHGDAIGVILTGTGSDGTLGIKEIKEHGGLTIAQDPIEAEFDGMPQSSIATGMVDKVLSLAEMPAALIRITSIQPKLPDLANGDDVREDLMQQLQSIFSLLRARADRDFSRYKRSTILRRIQRRMQLREVVELPDYFKLLRELPEEAGLLADDLLITVTSFFRDTEVFENLQERIIPQLFEKRGADDEIRVWSVGCATGEEAYSLAILLLEEASRRKFAPRIQVFASDLHERSLKKARDGFYPGDIESVVSEERLKRFFVRESSGFRIRKELREMVVFAPHNLMGDPPFSRIDLISCRNLMIYIQRPAQRDIIELFHYSLRSNGFLLLGSSETVDANELFYTDDKRLCLYRKRNVPAPEPRLPVFPLAQRRLQRETETLDGGGRPIAYGAMHQRMVEQYAPPSLLISPEDKVVNLSEHAGRYLVHPGGEPTTSVFKLVREELRIELRSALLTVREQKSQPFDTRPILVRFDGREVSVKLHVRAALEPAQEGFVLVIFDERPAEFAQEQLSGGELAHGETLRAHDDKLELELLQSRQRLQAIIEEYETSQEEMRAANEEMQSTNEELRSTMEELETSKEELQSMNEELQTVNQENRHKVEELAQLSSDLQNLLSATDIATLFLDRELRIMRFTPKVGDLFNIRLTDRGRPISDLTHKLGYNHLQEDARRVLERLSPVEREVNDNSAHWYLTRVMPYRSTADRIEGVVMTFVDITERKKAETAIGEAKLRADQIIETLPEPLLILSSDLRIKSANAAFYRHFKVKAKGTKGAKIYDIGNSQWDIPRLRVLLEEVLPKNKIFTGFEVEHEFEGLGRRIMLLNGRRLDDRELILLNIQDITERSELNEARERLAKIVDWSDDAIISKSKDGTILSWNGGAERLFGYTTEEAVGQSINLIIPPDRASEEREILRKLGSGDRIDHFQTQRIAKDGRRLDISLSISPILDAKGKVVGASKVARDVTNQKAAETRLRLLWESASVLLAADEPKAMLNEVFAKIAPHLGFDFYLNCMFDEGCEELSLASFSGLPDADAQSEQLRGFGEALCAAAAKQRTTIINTKAHASDSPLAARAKEFGLRSIVCNPLIAGDRLLGALSFGSRSKDEFTPDEIDFLKTISHYVTAAYERFRLIGELRLTDRRKDEFLATLAHELRNPLAPIRTGLELLKIAEDKLAIFDEVHGMMERQTRQLVTLVDDLLDVSRITRGKLDLKMREVLLSEVIDSAVEETKPFIDEAGHNLEVSVPKEPIQFLADPHRLAQVLSNLLVNSAKYTPRSGNISLAATVEGSEITIAVADDGIGIPAEMLKSIFEMFAQVPQSNQTPNAGLGIGLTLVKSLVEKHGGTIGVESEGPDKGSVFSIRIPITSKTPTQSGASKSKTNNRQDAKAKRVLVVDDNHAAAKVLSMLVQRFGHDVRTAGDGKRAVEVASEFHPEVVLMDIGMPKMDGHEAARQIRKSSWGKDVRLVALTGWGKEEDKRKTKEAGFDDHLVKPPEREALLEVLGRVRK